MTRRFELHCCAAVQGDELRNGRLLHGGFFLGPRDFYDKLRQAG